MCQECCRRRLPELIAHCEGEGMRLRKGRILVCAVAHGDHSHLRFRSRGNSRMHSPWFQMPAALPILLQVLPSAKFSLHLHEPWQNDEAEPKGLDVASREALDAHKHIFAKLRMDDTCPICLDCVPSASITQSTKMMNSLDGSGGGEEAGSTTLPCGHAFHDSCCGEWFSRSKKCPTCRFELTAPTIEAAAARVMCLETSGEYQQCDKGLGWLRAETTKAGGLAAAAAAVEAANTSALSWGEEEEEEEEDDDEMDSMRSGAFSATLSHVSSLIPRMSSMRRPSFRWSIPIHPDHQGRSSLLSAMFRHGRHTSTDAVIGSAIGTVSRLSERSLDSDIDSVAEESIPELEYVDEYVDEHATSAVDTPVVAMDNISEQTT